MNSGMITPAARMKNAVIAPRTISMIQNSVEASRSASLRLPLLQQFGEHRHERRRQRGVGEQVRYEVRHLEGDRERRGRAARAEEARGDDFAREPAIRETPVAIEKIAVLRADPSRRPGGAGRAGFLGECFGARGQGRYSTALRGAPALALPRAPCGSLPMANIHSQKKRILRSERERLENRRYTSTIKTYFRRLEAAVAGGDAARPRDAEHRELVSTIDKAVKRGALHRNTGARKKSRAARACLRRRQYRPLAG